MSLSKKVYCTYICKSPGKKVVNSSHFIIAIANHFDILQLEKAMPIFYGGAETRRLLGMDNPTNEGLLRTKD